MRKKKKKRWARHSEKRKRKRKRIVGLKKIICEQRKIRDFFFFSGETYIRIIVIDLIIMKLFKIYPVIFPFKDKGFFT